MIFPIRKAWQELGWVVRVSRPRFWIYLFGPYLIGIMAALKHLQGFEKLAFSARLEQLSSAVSFIFLGIVTTLPQLLITSPLTFLYILMVLVAIFGYPLLPANLLLYGVNDLCDADTDQFNPKKDLYELRLTSARKRSVITYIVLSQLPWIFLAIAGLVTIPNKVLFRPFLTLLLFIVLSLGYSIPPMRAKARPFLDSLFNVLYILPGLFIYLFILDGSMYISAPFPWLAFFSAALWCMAMHAYSAVPDIEADTRAHLPTIATKLGARQTLILCAALYVGSAGLALLTTTNPVFQAILIGLGAIYLFMMVMSIKYQHQLFSIYKLFPILNTLVGTILFFCVALL